MSSFTSQVRGLIHTIADQFELGPSLARLAIIEFSSSARIATPLTTSRSTVNNVISYYRPSGGTAISKGLDKAKAILLDRSGVRQGVNRVVLLLTDGVQNYTMVVIAPPSLLASTCVRARWPPSSL